MAAPVLQSTNTTGWQTTSSTDVTKPTGLAVGDLMISACFCNTNAGAVPTGFTSKADLLDGASSARLIIGYKIADSSDVAATNFTFNIGIGVANFCSISRITGASSSAEAYQTNSGSTSNTSTPSIGATVTPKNYGDSTLLLQFWLGTTGVSGTSTYAIATSNPTWTENFDSTDGAGRNASMASATRSQVTATGNSSCAGGGVSSDWAVVLMSIPITYSIAASDSLSTTEIITNNLTLNIDEESEMTESFDVDDNIVWSNTGKSSSTWTNTDKS